MRLHQTVIGHSHLEVVKNHKSQLRRCHFWAVGQEPVAHLGHCQRIAPHIAGWPVTEVHEWCGQFTPRTASIRERIINVAMFAFGVVFLLAIIASGLSLLRGG